MRRNRKYEMFTWKQIILVFAASSSPRYLCYLWWFWKTGGVSLVQSLNRNNETYLQLCKKSHSNISFSSVTESSCLHSNISHRDIIIIMNNLHLKNIFLLVVMFTNCKLCHLSERHDTNSNLQFPSSTEHKSNGGIPNRSTAIECPTHRSSGRTSAEERDFIQTEALLFVLCSSLREVIDMNRLFCRTGWLFSPRSLTTVWRRCSRIVPSWWPRDVRFRQRVGGRTLLLRSTSSDASGEDHCSSLFHIPPL